MTATVMVDLIDGDYVERPALALNEQLDLLVAARSLAGLCEYGDPGTCERLATHVAVATTESGPHAGHIARMSCCLAHANYYAAGWLGPHLLYPGLRGAVWIEHLDRAAA